ncbi:MAG: hypothetical protein M3136_05185 [Thermoproteota archaeon]|nr:hypothetical protein [Thermoproteota archaeon]
MTTTTTIIANRDPVRNVGRISKQVQFALCSYCFWCASSLDGRLGKVCPSCKGSTIDSIPLAGTQMLADNSTAKSVE